MFMGRIERAKIEARFGLQGQPCAKPYRHRLGYRAEQLLALLLERESEGRVAPSYREAADVLGLASHGHVHRIVKSLELRGYIERAPMFGKQPIIRLLMGNREPPPVMP